MSCNCVSTEDTVAYGDFLPYVLPFVAGCPDELAEFHVKQAAIELAKFSGALEYRQTINLWNGVNTYAIGTPEGYEFGRIAQLEYNGSTTANPFIDGSICRCGGLTFTVTPPNCITVSPTPSKDTADGLTVVTCVYPSQSSTAVDRDFAQRYYETIASGALERLFKLPETTWQSAPLSKDFGAGFRSGKVQARVDRMQNFTEGAIKMRVQRIV